MDRHITRLFLFLFTVGGSVGGVAYGGQAPVKTIAHDDSAHTSWANADRDKWRRKLATKKPQKGALLIKVRTR